ncbi:SDR family NAD(P)-dependent oxidoreductase [Aeromicrobium sp. Sec7.5]|uniref:SDR family NAD(P)-dependent oxidoreductase n=1 Tax=Aeromicrobium sp. Sec7.5 TaxID=3121276 RepID=UPI002FE4A13A
MTRVVVITGSSSGIGAEAAVQLGRRGWTVCLLARRADELDVVAARVRAAGGTASVHAVDLTDETATQAVVDQVLAEHGHVDVLVNNAGRSIRRSISDSLDRLHDHERVMAINYLAAVRLTHAFLPAMLERGQGHVVFSSTLSTQVPVPLFSAYLASKSALESYARSLLAELGHRGITTTVVYFPMVRTEMSGATSIYAAMPMMTSAKAGAWLVKATEDRPSRVTSLGGAIGQAGMSVLPGVLTKAIAPQVRRMDKRLQRKVRKQE